MQNEFSKVYAQIRNIAQSGRIGTPQVCVISVNTRLNEQDFNEKKEMELALMTDVLQSKTDKEKVLTFKSPYAYGFIAREYKNGNIGRYTYTISSAKENTQITVYATDGELRFDSETGKILLYPQVPDCVGEEYKE
jgi:hypothetical protein